MQPSAVDHPRIGGPRMVELGVHRIADVKRRVGCGQTHVYAPVGRGEFPAPISRGGRAVDPRVAAQWGHEGTHSPKEGT